MIVDQTGTYRILEDFSMRGANSISHNSQGSLLIVSQVDEVGKRVIGPGFPDWTSWNLPVEKVEEHEKPATQKDTINQKEIFEAMDAKEKKLETGTKWTFPDVVITYSDVSKLWVLRVGRIDGMGKTPLEAMTDLHKNAIDPDYKPVPF